MLRTTRWTLALVAAAAMTWGTSAIARADKPTIVEAAAGNEAFSTLVAAVQAADLVETLSGDGPFTVFAPTNDAFAALPEGTVEALLRPENKDRLAAILTYHVVSGNVASEQAVELDYATTVQGQRLNLQVQDGSLKVDEATVIQADIECSNGVIHVIDQVVLPVEATIPAIADEAGSFKTLLAAVEAAGLAEVLGSEGPFTVFAPTDAAFGKLPEGTVESLLEEGNRETLISILKYHVVAGRVYADQVVELDEAETLLGRSVRIDTEDGVKINNASVVATDIEASNGVIHVIDSVLIPGRQLAAREAIDLIREAIASGVPVYNRGHHSQCATIYRDACREIVSNAGPNMPEGPMQVLETTLDRASHVRHSGERAWMLRRGMDMAYMMLQDSASH